MELHDTTCMYVSVMCTCVYLPSFFCSRFKKLLLLDCDDAEVRVFLTWASFTLVCSKPPQTDKWRPKWHEKHNDSTITQFVSHFIIDYHKNYYIFNSLYKNCWVQPHFSLSLFCIRVKSFSFSAPLFLPKLYNQLNFNVETATKKAGVLTNKVF